MRILVAIPVHNEEKHAREVLDRVLTHAGNVLVVDDGSTDATPEILKEYPIDVIRHAVNRGYGRSVRDAFMWAEADGYDWVITMDSDSQHEPDEIPTFIEAAHRGDADIVSGSRYTRSFTNGVVSPFAPPADRRAINGTITAELNRALGTRFGATLTDSFCGFKAYRVNAVRKLTLDEDGYAFPMQFWVQAAANALKVREIPVSLIYNDLSRTFGAYLDDPEIRLAHYRDVMRREIARCCDRLPLHALDSVGVPAADTPCSRVRCACR